MDGQVVVGSTSAWGVIAFVVFAGALDWAAGYGLAASSLACCRRASAGLRAYRAEHSRLLALGKALVRGGSKARIARDGSVVAPPPPAPPAPRAAESGRAPGGSRRFLGFEDGDTARRVLHEFKRMRVRYVVPATVISVMISLFGIAKPYLTGNMFDVVQASGASMASVYPILVNLALIQLFTWLASIATGVLFALARWSMSMEMRASFFRTLLTQDMAFYDGNTSSELIGRLASEPDKMHELVNHSLERVLMATVNFVTGLYMSFQTDWQLALIAIVLRSPLLVQRANSVVQYYGRVQSQAIDAANTIASETLTNVGLVQAHVAEDSEIRDYVGHVRQYVDVIRYTLVDETVLRYTFLILNYIVETVVTVVGVSRIVQGQMTVGQFHAFHSYISIYAGGLSGLRDIYSQVQRLVSTSSRYFELRDMVPAINLHAGVRPVSPPVGRIDFIDVTFSYPRRPDVPVLEGLNLHCLPGKVLALVGPSGSGKSTIVRLCERFYDPTGGRVLLDGVDVRNLCPQWLRASIGYVAQEPAMLDRTIQENIGYGLDPPPSRESVEAAARDANAHDFIMSMPDGYDTLVGERGALLSGGQRQRIAIARALVRQPRILLLDEATSALDAEAEALVKQALERLMRGRSTIVIAHRLSTVRHADSIAVINAGRVEEVGTHETLMASAGRYREFIKHQLVDYRPAADVVQSRSA